MKIEQYPESRFRNAEFINLTDAVIEIAQTKDWSGTPLEKTFAEIIADRELLKENVNKESTSAQTQSVEQSDKLFDKGLSAIKPLCRMYELSPIESEVQAARTVRACIKAHGWNLNSESYNVEVTNGEMMVHDMENKTDTKAAIAQLSGMDIQVQRTKENIQNLKQSIKLREEKKGEQVTELDAKELRKRINNKLQNAYKYMEVMSEFQPGGEYDTMITAINSRIASIETSINMRSQKTKDKLDTHPN